MTGTAKTEEAEFEKIYNLNVVQVPTHKLIKRKDLSDLIYKNQYIKWRSVAQECLEMYKIGRPVLVGTTTIEKSELLAALLSEYNISYRILNAKPETVESESEIIAQAGYTKAVTIATNMAGRGTDILLGGNPTFLTKSLLKEFFLSENKLSANKEFEKILNSTDNKTKLELYERYDEFLNQNLADLELNTDPVCQLFVNLYKVIFSEAKVTAISEGQRIRDLGGLHVIGTERHESRRIDNQLRGRSGRQGDPGSSRFFLSLEDKLLKIFGGEQILTMMQSIGFQDDTPIQSSLLNKSLESAQKKVEAYYFDTRKQLFEYDQALNTQRNGVYAERRRILQQGNLRNWVLDYAERSLNDLFMSFKTDIDEKASQLLTAKLQNLLGVPFNISQNDSEKDLEQTLVFVKQQLHITYELKELEMESIEKGLLRELEKSFILQQIDYSWQEHLQKIAFLRDSIRWRAYGQKDPLTEYKKEAFNYFVMMLARIRHRVVYFVLRTKTIII
jgi:preprotein translocase subunit SecA